MYIKYPYIKPIHIVKGGGGDGVFIIWVMSRYRDLEFSHLPYRTVPNGTVLHGRLCSLSWTT